MNIGAGRVVYQDLMRIDKAIEDGSFFENKQLSATMDAVAARGSALHLMGLVSDGGVHSQLTHLTALLDMAKRKELSAVFVHAILDGRDTPPDSGVGYLQQVQDHIQAIGNGTLATICGRYYANVSAAISMSIALGKSMEAALEMMRGLLGNVPDEPRQRVRRPTSAPQGYASLDSSSMRAVV